LLHIALVAGEPSGDALGAALMRALTKAATGHIRFSGVGGPRMAEAGLTSRFPMSEIAVNGLLPVIRRLPLLLRRIVETADCIAADRPDVVVLVDAQDFNKRVAKRLKTICPDLPIIGYVAPTVWAWRPGRARALAPLLDRLLAVLPFEPEALARLGGPATIYVGHPLMERLADIAPTPDEEQTRLCQPQEILLLPGSRRAEIRRLLQAFGDAFARLHAEVPGLVPILPAVDHLREMIARETADWPVRPRLVSGEAEKWTAFRRAAGAIAASGTVTLELALARVPTVVAYRVSPVEREIGRRIITVRSAALPNLIADRPFVPEFLDGRWTGAEIAAALGPLLCEGPERQAQLDGFEQVRARMAVDVSPSDRAADEVLAAIARRAATVQP
jgi:lipid-A-disaccharide synthase